MKFVLCLSLGLLSLSYLSLDGKFSTLEGPYLGQMAPKDDAVVFLDGLVSTLEGDEMNAGFSLDGREFYYCARHRDDWSIYRTWEEDDRWTEPERMPFTTGFHGESRQLGIGRDLSERLTRWKIFLLYEQTAAQ